MRNPDSFEEALDALEKAITHINRNKPQTQCQSSRLAEQVCKIDAICAQSMRAIMEDK
jgi:hypothetical protein